MKKLLNQNKSYSSFSYLITTISLVFYRFKLTMKNLFIYIRFPLLLLLELFYVIEEALLFFISIFKPIKKDPTELYGTISFSAIKEIFKIIDYKPVGIICDLGCGKGKFLLYCMLVSKCKTIGIESNRYYTFIYGVLIRFFFRHNQCELINESITTSKLPTCDLLFVSGLCFNDPTLNYIQDYLNIAVLKPIFISVAVKFHLQNYNDPIEINTDLSWGKETVFIYVPNLVKNIDSINIT